MSTVSLPDTSRSRPLGHLSERGLVAAALATASGAGCLLHLWAPPGPRAAVLAAAGTCLLACAAALLARRLRDALGGLRFAGTLLATLAVASALGTLVLQGKPVAAYHERYGRAADLLLALRLDDVFHSGWFGALLGLLAAGLVISAARRWPPRLRNAGFFACHAGLLACLTGAGVSAVFAVRGRIDLRTGQGPVSDLAVERRGDRTGERQPLGFSVRLDRFELDRYAPTHRVGLYSLGPEEEWTLKTSFDPRPGAQHRLPGGARFRIKGYYPDLTVDDRVAPDPEGRPMLRATIDGAEVWLMDGEVRASADGALAVGLHGKRAPVARVTGPRHVLVPEGLPPQALQIGQSVRWPQIGRVTALRFLPHFSLDLETREVRSLSDRPENPALEVRIAREDGESEQRWLFASAPAYQHEGQTSGRLGYRIEPQAPPPRRTVVVDLAARAVRVPDGPEQQYSEGLVLADGRVALGTLLERARWRRELGTASQEPKNPAVEVEVEENGETRDAVLIARTPSALRFGDGLALGFERRGEDARAFRSQVHLARGDQTLAATVAVNEPVRFGGWTLYQVNYDPKDPTYSGLDAVFDPGLVVVFAGFALIVLGVAYTLYAEPRLKRRGAAA